MVGEKKLLCRFSVRKNVTKFEGNAFSNRFEKLDGYDDWYNWSERLGFDFIGDLVVCCC